MRHKSTTRYVYMGVSSFTMVETIWMAHGKTSSYVTRYFTIMNISKSQRGNKTLDGNLLLTFRTDDVETYRMYYVVPATWIF